MRADLQFYTLMVRRRICAASQSHLIEADWFRCRPSSIAPRAGKLTNAQTVEVNSC